MRTYWPTVYALFALVVCTATKADKPAIQPAGMPGQAEQQHPIAIEIHDATTDDDASCAVCERIEEMLRTPIAEPFTATVEVQPNSQEAACQVHAPLREAVGTPFDPTSSDQGPVNVHLRRLPHDASIGIFFGTSGRAFPLEVLRKPESQGSSYPGRGRRVDPKWIDLDILKEWTSIDAVNDGGPINLDQFAAGHVLQRPAYLVDVADGRLVDTSAIAEEHLSYVVLPYSGGRPGDGKRISTKGEQLMRFQQYGAFFDPDIMAGVPRAFRDAIELVRLLEYRYVWIFSLCVVQDDKLARQTEVAKMADILVGAAFAIILDSDLAADEGIQGIKELANPQPRNLKQHLHSFKDETFLALITTQWIRQYYREKAIGKNPQQMRKAAQTAWNVQDNILTRRQLRFAYSSVVWYNGSCHSCEEIAGFCDKNPSRLRSPASVFPDPFGVPENGRGTAQHLSHWTDAFLIPWFSMDHYFQALRQLTMAGLPNPGEIIEAASGLISALGSRSRGGFICGMPEERLDIALLFSVAGDGNGLYSPERRKVGPLLQPDLPWPSWSWAGWIGHVILDRTRTGSDYLELNRDEDTISIVEWFASDSPNPNAPRRRLETRIWDDAKQRFQHNMLEPTPSQWNREDSEPIYGIQSRNEGGPGFNPKVVYTHASLSGLRFAYPIPMQGSGNESATSSPPTRMTTERYLSCKIDRAFLHIRSSDYTSHIENQLYRVWGPNGQQVGVLQATRWDDLTRLLNLSSVTSSGAFEMRANANAQVPGDYQAEVEVVALSKSYTRWDDDVYMAREIVEDHAVTGYYEYYNIMWIEWTEGIAYRKGIGRVAAEVWDQLDVERIDLVLG